LHNDVTEEHLSDDVIGVESQNDIIYEEIRKQPKSSDTDRQLKHSDIDSVNHNNNELIHEVGKEYLNGDNTEDLSKRIDLGEHDGCDFNQPSTCVQD
jgi:hypothetical protein